MLWGWAVNMASNSRSTITSNVNLKQITIPNSKKWNKVNKYLSHKAVENIKLAQYLAHS